MLYMSPERRGFLSRSIKSVVRTAAYVATITFAFTFAFITALMATVGGGRTNSHTFSIDSIIGISTAHADAPCVVAPPPGGGGGGGSCESCGSG